MPHIRPLTHRDCTALAHLHKASTDPCLSATGFASLLRQKHIYSYGIAQENHSTSIRLSNLCGFMIVQKLLDEAEIIDLCIAPTHQRRGWGTILMGTFLEEAWAHNIQKVFLEVAADNTPAQKLYLKFGFKPYARRPRYYKRNNGQRVDAYNYVKER